MSDLPLVDVPLTRRNDDRDLTALRKTTWQREWWLELSSALLAVGAAIAIVTVLLKYQNSTVPRLPFGVTINTILSVLSIVLRGSLMVGITASLSQLKWFWFQRPRSLGELTTYDGASRGIWGSILMVYRLPLASLAQIGALVTILAVGINPFIQQSIDFQTLASPSSLGNASIARINSYGIIDSGEGGVFILDPPMQGAILRALYNSSAVISPVCATGNCTFPDYRSVGMCSSCVDAVQTVNATCTDGRNIIQNCTGAACASELDPNCIIESSTWSAPDNPAANVTVPYGGRTMRVATSALGSNASRTYLTVTDIFAFSKAAFTQMISAKTDGTFRLSDFVVTAKQCTLYPCVRTYRLDIQAGRASESILSSQRMQYAGDLGSYDSPGGAYNSTPMPCLVDGKYLDASAFTRPTSIANNTVNDLLPNNKTAYLPPECVFELYEAVAYARYLEGTVLGEVIVSQQRTLWDPPWMSTLHNRGDPQSDLITAFWDELALGITSQMRSAGVSLEKRPAHGDVWHTETYLIVRWLWLTLPAVLVIASVVFLLMTILKTRRGLTPSMWKDSPVPLLFHGLDMEHRHLLEPLVDVDDMQNAADEMVVRLHRDSIDGSIRLITEDSNRSAISYSKYDQSEG